MPVFLDNQDFVWGLGLVVSGAFIYYLAFKYGITRFRENLINSRYSDMKIGKWFDIILKYVIPFELMGMSAWFLFQTLTSPIEEWWIGGPIGLGILVLQWALAMGGLWYMSSRVKGSLVDDDFSIDTTIDEDIDRFENGPTEDVEPIGIGRIRDE